MSTIPPIEKVLGHLDHPRRARDSWEARCPAHDDGRRPSLTVREASDGRVLLHCHGANCSVDSICRAAGLEVRDLFPRASELASQPARGRIAAAYDYHSADGDLLYQVVRFDPKGFRQRRPDGAGGWTWSLNGTERVLYRLPELRRAPADRGVFVVEGEKDADHLTALGLVATSALGGAGKWRPEYGEALRERHVYILPDNDEPGRLHAQEVATALDGIAREVRILELPGLDEKGDVSDWLDAGGTLKELKRLAKATAPWQRPDPATITPLPPVQPDVASLVPPQELAEEAFHGLAGEIVRTIEPHTEADPAALLVQLLAAVGNMAGRSAHFTAEADRHFMNLFAVLVGDTAKGRKGSSWGRIRDLAELVDPTWAASRVEHGLSSGEGLIWAVRDRIERAGKDGAVEVVDAGVDDKRLLVHESEFASPLRVIQREGNTLSAVIRQAWDVGDMHTLTKNSPARGTGAHVSIIGHITRDELRRYLTVTEQGNGFGNRFLWIAVKRSKVLPEGGGHVNLDPLADDLRRALAFASRVGEVRRDESARTDWHRVYEPLSEGKPGLLGAMIARGEAQVMRLATLYAVLDRSDTIGVAHLRAALAVWDYAEASARWIFGDQLGDPVTAAIWRCAQQAGSVTRTGVHTLLGRNASAGQIGQALRQLEEQGLMRRTRRETGGRPAETWEVA